MINFDEFDTTHRDFYDFKGFDCSCILVVDVDCAVVVEACQCQKPG